MNKRSASLVFLVMFVSTGALADEIDLIDDSAFQGKAQQALLQWLEQADHVSASVLNDQLQSRTHHPVQLPSPPQSVN